MNRTAGLLFEKRPAPRHIRGENLFHRHQPRLQEIEKFLDFAALPDNALTARLL